MQKNPFTPPEFGRSLPTPGKHGKEVTRDISLAKHEKLGAHHQSSKKEEGQSSESTGRKFPSLKESLESPPKPSLRYRAPYVEPTHQKKAAKFSSGLDKESEGSLEDEKRHHRYTNPRQEQGSKTQQKRAVAGDEGSPRTTEGMEGSSREAGEFFKHAPPPAGTTYERMVSSLVVHSYRKSL